MQPEGLFSQPASQVIRRRFSCRTYEARALTADVQAELGKFLHKPGCGPFGGRARFVLASASPADRSMLNGLGTYGFIHGAAGFIIGAVEQAAEHNLEDFGYLMELIVLRATDLGLGTCWLGGTFTKSSFGRKVDVQETELVPAVAAVGYPARSLRWIERLVRGGAQAERRLPWESLFFNEDFKQTLNKQAAGDSGLALELVRLGPSASNKQPWRVLKSAQGWHFFLERTPGYRESTLVRLFTVADMQRIDMGIALCHFELGQAELGQSGAWQELPAAAVPGWAGIEYVTSWIPGFTWDGTAPGTGTTVPAGSGSQAR